MNHKFIWIEQKMWIDLVTYLPSTTMGMCLTAG